MTARPEFAADTGQACVACHENGADAGPLTDLGRGFLEAGNVLPDSARTSAAGRWLRGLVRYLHLVGAVVWFGAIIYIHLFIKPRRLIKGLPRGEVWLGWASIALMTVTGTFLTVWRVGSIRELWTTTFGIVLLLKLAAFAALVCIAALVTIRLDRRMKEAANEGCGVGGCGRVRFAYDGYLYDATESELWKGGVHVGRHHAGADLTEALPDAPHGPEVLDHIEKVGPVAGSATPKLPSAARAFVRLAYLNLGLIALILLCVSYWSWGPPLVGREGARGLSEAAGVVRGTEPPAGTSAASRNCIECHREERIQPVQIAEWRESVHASIGVGCFECHGAEQGDVDAFEHYGETIATIVSPRDCGRCHDREVAEFAASRHAEGAQILASLDNYLGEVVEGVPAGVSGCLQCHGSDITVREDGRLSSESWPNSGIGRMNPDGTKGSCSACHPRHRFASAVARRPENCGRCHLGPDHPQFEIYQESKHGVAFAEASDRMALDSADWRLGTDYTAAPTCVTCHNGATQTTEFTHDVGTRIAWTLRPAVSTRLENWEARRARMVSTCEHCHSPGWVGSFFSQYDEAVGLYNRKFAEPSGGIMADLRRAGILTERQFDEKIEWTYFLLWHHEGRRARHGAAMMGPDYVQWHGFFEVAERFYMELVPEAEELLPGVTSDYLAADEHRWLRGLPDETRRQIEDFYRERYNMEP
jgi:predicted heme/steroid binding protein